jgi:hypothetical protein
MRRQGAKAGNAENIVAASAVLILIAMAPTVGSAGISLAQTGDAKAAADPVMQQLAAFRRDDYDAAYDFASAEIRQMFDRAAFERMVKGGYPEIARSTCAVVAESRVTAEGHALVRVKIQGANGNGIEALYEMVLEDRGWRINGVVARPDPGMV